MLPEAAEQDTTTTLLVDPRTGRILKHEDSWEPPPLLRLPWAWRRANGLCAATVARLLGWQRLLCRAEERSGRGGGRAATGAWREERRLEPRARSL